VTFLNVLGVDVSARIKTAIGTTLDDFLSAALQANDESVRARLNRSADIERCFFRKSVPASWFA